MVVQKRSPIWCQETLLQDPGPSAYQRHTQEFGVGSDFPKLFDNKHFRLFSRAVSNVGYSDALKALDERRGETVQEIQSRNGKYFANPAVQLCDNDFHVAELSTLNSVRRRLASSQTQQIGSASDQQTAEVIVKQLHRIKRMGLCRYVGLSAEPLTGPLRLKDNWKWMDWVIVGGESTQGGECRVMDLAWAESLVDDCKRLRVSCFVKQLGSKPGVMKKSGAWCPREIEDPKGGSPAEWPRKLRVRRYPTGEREI